MKQISTTFRYAKNTKKRCRSFFHVFIDLEENQQIQTFNAIEFRAVFFKSHWKIVALPIKQSIEITIYTI